MVPLLKFYFHDDILSVNGKFCHVIAIILTFFCTINVKIYILSYRKCILSFRFMLYLNYDSQRSDLYEAGCKVL